MMKISQTSGFPVFLSEWRPRLANTTWRRPNVVVMVCFWWLASLSHDQWWVRRWNSNRNESSAARQGISTLFFVYGVRCWIRGSFV